MAEAAPPEVVGRNLNLIVRGAPEFGANGLLRFYLAHVVGLPLVGIIAFGVHYYKVILHGHSLPPENEDVGVDTAKKVPLNSRTYFMPKILTRELYYVVILIAIMVIWATFAYHAPLEPHADPLVTPLHTTAPWYFLWLQGMLKLGDKVIWGIVLPTIAGALLFVFPYVEVGPSRRYGHRRLGLSVGVLSVALLVILSFMGTPWFGVETSPEQESIATLLPQTRSGPVRLADWNELTIGAYEAANWEDAPTETLQELLHTFNEEVSVAEYGDRTAWEGIMIIEDWQPSLKKLTLRVLWVDSATGAPGEFSETVYLHQFSDYGQGE